MKSKVYEIDFEGCTPYSSYVEGYYAVNGVIYNSNDEIVSDEEVEIRNLGIDSR